MRKQAGLTLIELIVSMFILSIMSVVALSSFQQMIRAREVQRAHETVLNQLSFAYTTLLNDFAAPLKEEGITFNEHMISITHHVKNSEGEEESVHQEYVWEDDHLTRTRTQGADTMEQHLIQHVSGLQWHWLSEGEWHDVSVPGKVGKSLHGFKMTFQDKLMGEVTWIFAVP